MNPWNAWAELLVRSSVVLGTGALIRLLYKRASARNRCHLIYATFLLLVLLPAFAAILPEMDLHLPTGTTHAFGLVTVRQLVTSKAPAAPVSHVNWPVFVWLAGFSFVIARLCVGLIAVRELVRESDSFDHPALAEMRNRATVRVSRRITSPVTCGVFVPHILLPHGAQQWSRTRLEAVLRHESAHLERRDVTLQIAAQLVAAVWWFQPLVWLACRQMRADCEFACDESVVSSGMKASVYGAELLAIAGERDRQNFLAATAIAMARRNDLDVRIKAILKPPVRPSSRSVLVFGATAITAVTLAAASLGSRADQSDNQGGLKMKRTVLSALLASAGLSAATVTGVLHDSTGAPLSDVAVSMYNPDTGARQEVTTNSEGKFSISGVGAGQYILRVTKPGFPSIFRTFDLKGDSEVDRQLTMSDGNTPAVEDVVNHSGDTSKPVRIGGQVAQANLQAKVNPTYPASAKAAHLEGEVMLDVQVSKDGVPVDLRVVSSPGDDLSQSALEAVRQWRYRPTLLNGQPVAIVTQVKVKYTLAR
jgi:TonB family protein